MSSKNQFIRHTSNMRVTESKFGYKYLNNLTAIPQQRTQYLV